MTQCEHSVTKWKLSALLAIRVTFNQVEISSAHNA